MWTIETRTSWIETGHVLRSIKQEIEDLRWMVEKVQLNEQEETSKNEISGRLLEWLLYIDKNTESNNTTITDIIEQLRNKDLENINYDKLITELGSYSTELNETHLEKLSEIFDITRESREELWDLRETIDDLWIEPELVEEVKQVSEQFKTMKNELMSFKDSMWYQVAISMLPKWFVKSTVSWWEWRFDIVSFINSITSAFVPILAFIFPWFAPERLKNLVNSINGVWDWMSYKLKSNTELVWKIFEWEQFDDLRETLTEQWQWVVDQAWEVTEEKIAEMVENFRWFLPDFIRETFWKTMTDEQVNKVIENINLEERLKDKRNLVWIFKYWVNWKEIPEWEAPANYLLWVWESIIIPFELFWDISNELVDLDVIKWTDIVFQTVRSWVETAVDYSFRAISLFSSGMRVPLWQMDREMFFEKMSELYEKSPDEAKIILYTTLYRSWWPILWALWSVVEFAWKSIAYWLLDNRTLGDSFDAVKSWLSWNIYAHVRFINELKDSIPSVASDLWLDKTEVKLKQLYTLVDDMNINKRLVETFRSIDSVGGDFSKFGEQYQRMFWETDWINFSSFIDKDSVLQKINDRISWTGSFFDEIVRDWKAAIKWNFVWLNSLDYVLNWLWKNIRQINSYMSKVLMDDALIQWVSRIIWKARLAAEWLEIPYSVDRVKFKIDNVNDLREFGRNMSTLAKESPELLKSIVWKFPIIAIWALEFTWEDSPDSLWEVSKILVSLVPVVWPLIIMTDATYVDNFDTAWVTLWAALLTIDWVFAINAWRKWFWSFMRYMAQPVVDIAQLGWMIAKRWWYWYKMTSDWLRLAFTNPKGCYREIASFIENFIERRWIIMWRWKVAAIATWLLIIWGVWISYFSDEELPEEIKENINNPEELDKILRREWVNLDKEQKEKIIELSVMLRLWIQWWDDSGITWVDVTIHEDWSITADIQWDPDTEKWIENSALYMEQMADMKEMIDRLESIVS